jgi:heat shock protein HslJ
MHTSRTSLDWAGTYEGLLPCADCAGLHLQLTLEQDDSFVLVSRRLVRGATPSRAQGQFEWAPDGNSILLDTEGDEQHFAVGEGRLLWLEVGQTQPAWGRSEAVLPQSSAAWRSTRQELGAMLEDHRWMLIHAADASNQRLDALFPDAEQSFVFDFTGSGLHVRGGCNGLRGAFRVEAGDMLAVTGAMSTLMACAEPLMEADAALATLTAEPLEMVLIGGEAPTLALLSAAGDALVLRGELTHEARFGAPTRIFLEVAEQTIACEGSTRGEGRCLQVRERTFDEQGLLVGEPSEWRTFTADIQGYQHETGIRTVLRVDRFQPPAGAEAVDGPLYVLDMVVQSEVIRQ